MIKLVKYYNYNTRNLSRKIKYGRLIVVKVEDAYLLTLAFKSKTKSFYMPTLKVLKKFPTKEEIIPFLKEHEDELYGMDSLANLEDVPCANMYTCWVVANFCLNNEKLKVWEIKSQLMGWKPYFGE